MKKNFFEKSNLVLVGMPGAGKSTIGVVVAKLLGYNFIDSDIVIQEKDGRLLKDIIEEEGTEGFISIENKINAGIDAVKSVIATGGSVIYGKEAMEHLKATGCIVYISATYEELVRRLGDLHQRGVVLKPEQDLKALYDERSPLYEKYADITIHSDVMNIRTAAMEIAERYKTWLSGTDNL